MTASTSTPPLALEKRVIVTGATVQARYTLRAVEGRTLTGRWAGQWDLALTAGNAPDRYLTLPGRPSLGSSGRTREGSSVALVDEWVGIEASLSWDPEAELAWGPVETISVSESGYERIYQGTALLFTWPLDGRGVDAELTVGLTVSRR
jgi:hypothetical protein